MKPIPDTLKGQEAKDFLEWDIWNSHLIGLGTVDSMKQSFVNKTEARNFYSQPFTPDMITEYFENWRKDFTARIEGVFRPTNSGGGVKATKEDYNCFGIANYFPETLNDFISDCRRALRDTGTKLTWKGK